MKKTEIQELKSKTQADLQKMLGEVRAKMRGLLFDLELGKVKNIGEVRQARKLIARIQTFIKTMKTDLN